MEKKLPYKVEAKHNLWRVFLEQGSYSDYRSETFIFAGSSAEEIWERLKQWSKSFDKIIHRENKEENYNDNRYLRIDSFEFGEIRNKFSEETFFETWDCTITPLDVIYFAK